MRQIIVVLLSLISIKVFSQAGQIWYHYDTSNSPLPDNLVLCVASETNSSIWMGTNKGLAKLQNGTWTIYNKNNSPLLSDTIMAIGIAPNNDKWICCRNRGILKFDGTNWTSFTPQNSNPYVDAARRFAFEGSKIWVAGRGLLKYDGNTWTAYRTENSGIPSNYIYSVALEGHIKWIMSGSDGAAKFNDTTWTLYNTQNSPLPNNFGAEVFVDKDKTKWFSLDFSNLAKYNNTNWVIYNSTNSGYPAGIICDQVFVTKDLIFYGVANGGQGGLVKFNGISWIFYTPKNSPISTSSPICLSSDSLGNKWIGSNAGVDIFNETGIVNIHHNSISIIKDFELEQNYPNPFNPSTTIKYSLPKQAFINLKLYDAAGKFLKELVNEFKSSGSYNITFDGSKFASGIYFYKLETSDFSDTKRMVLVK